jgi:hypothetical protein
MNSLAASQATREGRQRRLRKWVALPVYVAAAILMVNQRVGWEDEVGMQLLPIVLRSDIWIALALALALVVSPHWTPAPARVRGVSKQILIYAPILFLLFTLLASSINGVTNGSAINAFGAGDLFKGVLCAGLSLLIFKLTVAHEGFGHRVVDILIWAPAANMVVGLFAVVTLINNIPGFNTGVEDGGAIGAGIVGLGGRFQGLGSNANIAMTQTAIGLALLVPRILCATLDTPLWKKAALLLYGSGMCAIMAWTAVRAALVIWPTIFLVLLWLRFRFTGRGLIDNAALLAKNALFVALAWAASAFMDTQATLLERMQDDDGRLFLWVYYLDLLVRNPMGLGLGFETIAGSGSIIEGQRLPPHNALLQAGMYAGIGGMLVSVFLILRVGALISRIKRYLDRSEISLDLMGLTLAWCSIVISVMFAGLLQSDFNFSIVTGLLLGIAARSKAFRTRKPLASVASQTPTAPSQVALNPLRK